MNATETFEPKNIEAGYEQVKNLIFHQVHKFFAQYGGDFDELVGEANLAFVRGHNEYATGHTATGLTIDDPYHVVIRRWVWFSMFDAMRARLQAKAVTQPAELTENIPAEERWDAKDYTAGLGADAYTAAMLVLRPPEEIEAVAQAKGGEPRNYRSTVRAYLGNLGWDEGRINRAFAEIRETL